MAGVLLVVDASSERLLRLVVRDLESSDANCARVHFTKLDGPLKETAPVLRLRPGDGGWQKAA